MEKIKFTTERMQELHNHVDEIISQLLSSINKSNEILCVISSNIQSDNITSTLSSYVSMSEEKSKATIENLKLLNKYLEGKIGTYTSKEQTGVESMNEILNLLNQLNV